MTAPTVTPLMSKAERDVWADIYAQAKIAELITIPLSEFLQDPWNLLASAGQESAFETIAAGHRPLLPKQVMASKAIHAQWDAEPASKRCHLRLVVNR